MTRLKKAGRTAGSKIKTSPRFKVLAGILKIIKLNEVKKTLHQRRIHYLYVLSLFVVTLENLSNVMNRDV